MKLSVMCPSMGGHEEAMNSWADNATGDLTMLAMTATEGKAAGFLSKCQQFHEQDTADIQGFLHSDLFIHERGWDERVLREFAIPSTAVVGFVGATRLASPDIYRTPYDFRQLARADVWSNLTDWASHGAQETGSKGAAVLDSCAVFVRRSFLHWIGGWAAAGLPDSSHCSDLWISCMAHRHGLATRIVGISATHRGGGKGEVGSQWLVERGGDVQFHRDAHRVIYEQFRDVLPIVIEQQFPEQIQFRVDKKWMTGPLPSQYSSWQGLEKIMPCLVERFCHGTHRALEFGVEYGYSTAVLASLFDEVVGIDHFQGDDHSGHRDAEQIAKDNLHHYRNVALCKDDYRNWIKLKGANYDLIHVDIVHTYEDTYACGEWAIQHSPVVIFHDTESYPEVLQAVRALAVGHGCKFYNYRPCNGLGILVRNA